MSKHSTEYFKGLNGIRAIAAIGVLISHSLQEIHTFGFRRMGALQFGGEAVTIFFTLSGFLITYLLLTEREKYKTIDVKRFYLRRVLRIWPLYFFYIALVFVCYKFVFALPMDNWQYVYLYALFLGNFAFNLNIYPANLGHLWSIAIEEQFYAFWPLILRYSKDLKRFLIVFIISLIALRTGIKFYSDHFHYSLPYSIAACMRFDNMSIGALYAIAFYNKNPRLLKWSRSIWVQIAFYGFVLLALFNRFNFLSIYADDVVSVVTGLFIVSQVTNTKKVTLLENPVMIFLGQISYGIYVYHVFLISVFAWLVKRYALQGHLGNPVLVVLGIMVATLGVAYLSYQFIELPFLRLKNKFALVKSGRLKV